ncbi:hypothetical protein HWV62_5145 [Athelia sp. TMB]|nr:hypothetical protein HWV62_5145 [Athelia sp. TMB]
MPPPIFPIISPAGAFEAARMPPEWTNNLRPTEVGWEDINGAKTLMDDIQGPLRESSAPSLPRIHELKLWGWFKRVFRLQRARKPSSRT